MTGSGPLAGVRIVELGMMIAGPFAGRLLADLGADVAVLTAGQLLAGSSPRAQGGVAAAVGADDAPALHAADTLAVGAGLNDASAVDVLTREGTFLIEDGVLSRPVRDLRFTQSIVEALDSVQQMSSDRRLELGEDGTAVLTPWLHLAQFSFTS